MTIPTEKSAATMGENTVMKPAATTDKASDFLVKYFATVKARGGGVSATGPVFTKQEADYAVQSVYQQMLGRNATGNDYSKAVNLIMAQSQDTSTAARHQN